MNPLKPKFRKLKNNFQDLQFKFTGEQSFLLGVKNNIQGFVISGYSGASALLIALVTQQINREFRK